MKWTFSRLAVMLVSALGCASGFSSSTPVVYGWEQAEHASTKRGVYVQAGSFLDSKKARHCQRFLRSKQVSSIKIVRKKNFYAVLVGPLYTSSALKKTAKVLRGSLRTPHHHVQQKFPYVVHDVFVPQRVTTPFPVQATAVFTPPPASNGHWFAALGAGAQYPDWHANIPVNNGSNLPTPYNVDLYSTQTNAQPVIAVFAGRRWERDVRFLPAYSLGVFWQYLFTTQVGNQVMLYSDPQYVNYNYQWNVDANLVLASGKLNLIQYGMFSPFVNGGIGGAFNHAGFYHESALPNVTPRNPPGFSSHVSTQFAYNVGAGLDVRVRPNMIVSAGYLYQDLGNVLSGSGTGTWANQDLNIGAYRSNEFLISLTYLFEK